MKIKLLYKKNYNFLKTIKTNNGDIMSKEENKEILLLHKGKFIWKFVVSILLNVLLLIIPIYYSKLIDALSISDFNSAYLFIIVFGSLTILFRIIDYFNQKAYFWLYLALYKSYMDLGLTKTFNNSLYSLSRFSLSEYSNIMSEDFEMISDYYSTLVIRIVEILEFLYIIIYFFFINSLIGLITLISSSVVIFILFYFNKFISNVNTERKLRNDKRISLFQEIFLGVKTIKGFNILKVIKNRLNNAIDDYIKWHTKLNMNRYSLREVGLGIVDVFKIISLVIGIRLIMIGNMTLGTITIIYSYYSKLSELFTSIIVLSESLNNKKVSEKRVMKLFQYATNHEVDSSNNNDVLGNISFKNALYGNKISPLLNNVSFDINNKSLTILSGSVKSCEGVFDLLLRYNRLHEGNILIDNVNLSEYSSENISNIMGFVMEYPTFFNTSIRENLSIFDSNFENILSVCKYLDIDSYIMSLEKGYETILKTDASNIHNDVKYLLAFARVFLKKSKIILINNILDHVSRPIYDQILKMLIELSKEHTIIMITRDINLLKNKNVSKVIFLAYGKVIGDGKHNKLIKNNEKYKELIYKM